MAVANRPPRPRHWPWGFMGQQRGAEEPQEVKGVLVMASGRFDEREHEFYCWAADPDEEGQRSQWFVRDVADDRIVAGPFDIDACIQESARRNRELEEK